MELLFFRMKFIHVNTYFVGVDRGTGLPAVDAITFGLYICDEELECAALCAAHAILNIESRR